MNRLTKDTVSDTRRKYCEFNHLQVGSIVFEDYSARNFDRPEWQKLLANCRKFRGQTQQILFTKWDRFSRNTGDAYQMISTLSNLGIKLQAIEQPLDLEIPEQKMMLAFYLAAPEVENDRRALNTLQGMRREKKKDGTWVQHPLAIRTQKMSLERRSYSLSSLWQTL
ncbi:recombinase family protein [Algoriphagus resistens]|uniref:recombinase family protein n=1 Tax=Algoriphagus resistens TaxID=1750590 RepID=UPI0007167E9D|nr:recombinase family protein [Algoriphagus resistens]